VTVVSSLRLTGFKPDETVRTLVTIDTHVGFDFSAPTGAAGKGHIFLRDVSSAAFVELSIDLSSGRLSGVTLVGSVPAGRDLHLGSLKHSAGLPVFGNHGFDVDAVMPSRNEDAALSTAIGSDYLFIRLSDDAPDELVACGRAVFLFSKHVLVGVGATSLTSVEMNAARQSIAAS
jgi:hypothetical protein